MKQTKKWRVVDDELVFEEDARICRTFWPNEKEHARLIAASPIMYNFIKEKADSGDTEAIKIISEITLDS